MDGSSLSGIPSGVRVDLESRRTQQRTVCSNESNDIRPKKECRMII